MTFFLFYYQNKSKLGTLIASQSKESIELKMNKYIKYTQL